MLRGAAAPLAETSAALRSTAYPDSFRGMLATGYKIGQDQFVVPHSGFIAQQNSTGILSDAVGGNGRMVNGVEMA